MRVGRAELVPRALRHAHDQRHRDLTAEHVVDVRRVVDDLVEGQEREVDRHQLDHRAQPGHGRSHAHADDRVLRDRGVAHAPLAELLQQPRRDLEGAPEHADVLAHEHHALIAAQLLAQRRAQRLAVAQLGHQEPSPPRSAASSPASSASVICWGISSVAPSGSAACAGWAAGLVVRTEYVPRATRSKTYTSS